MTFSDGKKMPKIFGNETSLLLLSPNFSIFLQKLSVRGSETIWFLLISSLAKLLQLPKNTSLTTAIWLSFKKRMLRNSGHLKLSSLKQLDSSHS